MRNLVIQIFARIGIETDNEYIFHFSSVQGNNDDLDDSPNTVYAPLEITLNYSILSSAVTSNIILGMSKPLSDNNALKSGQYITITDNGITIFQGILLTCNYIVLEPLGTGNQGNISLELTIAPSIYQFTLMPAIFDQDQVNQINELLNIDVSATLAGGVTQSIKTSNLLDYIVSNSDYNLFFNGTINASDLDENVYLMTYVNDKRDSTLRRSIDFFNAVFYQQEDGQIIIRQLDYALNCPFDVDIQNSYNTIDNINEVGTIPILSLLTYQYTDNAYSTPAVISNYSMIDADLAQGAKATSCILSYAPNPQFFSRLQELQKSNWFVGDIGQTQINNNIITDPTTAKALDKALDKFFAYPDAFMITSQATGVKDQFLASYQALLTAKQTAEAISSYAAFTGTVSLDDPNCPDDLGNIIGTIIQLQGLTNMSSGVIATATRSYSTMGSFLTFTVAPPGSYTGFWKNSTATAQY